MNKKEELTDEARNLIYGFPGLINDLAKLKARELERFLTIYSWSGSEDEAYNNCLQDVVGLLSDMLGDCHLKY